MDAKLIHNGEITKNNAANIENNPLTINELTPRETAKNEAAKTRTHLPIPFDKARLNLPVTIFKGDGKIPTTKQVKPIEKTTLGAFLATMQKADPLSIEVANNLKNAYVSYKETGDKKPYDALKINLEAVTFGDYDYRKDEKCLTYYGLLGADVDGYDSVLEKDLDFEHFKTNPYVLAAFNSPGTYGLRLLIVSDATFETHKTTYKALLNHLSEFANLKIGKPKREEEQVVHLDATTINPSQLWFFTHTTDVYLNVESDVFTPSVLTATDTATVETTPSVTAATDTAATSKTFKKPHTHDGTLSDADKIAACMEMAKTRNISDGDTNPYVFQVSCIALEHGVTSESLLSYFSSYYAYRNFDKSEFFEKIQKPIDSAAKRTHQKYTDAQLFKYLKNGDPSVIGPVTKVATATPSVPKAKTAKIKPETTTNDGDASDGDGGELSDETDGKTPKIVLIEQYLTRRYDLRNNVVSNDVEISKRGKNRFETVNEDELIVEILKTGLNGVEKPLMSLLRSKYPKPYNPLKAYFEDVNAKYQWKNGDFDHIGHLASHVTTTDQYFFNTQFKKMLCRVVACAVGHIPFNKQCLTFVGKQNDGKTSFVRFLMPKILNDYIKENLDFDKDGRLALCQNLIINLDELASLSKNDINQVKTYFTVETVKDRPPYGKKPISFKRTASFFASTNNSEFLTDETGNVRWLVFGIDGFNFSYRQNVDINAVWSQAYALLLSGFECQMTNDELAHSEKNNQQFKRSYTELELLQSKFLPSKKDEPNAVFMTANEIKEELEIGHTNRKLYHVTVGKALRDSNFERVTKKTTGSYSLYGFYVVRIE